MTSSRLYQFAAIFVVGIITPHSAWVQTPPGPLTPQTRFTLAEVLEGSVSGFKQIEDEPQDWPSLIKQADEFVQLRQGKLTLRRKLNWVAQCLLNPSSSIFCDYLLERREGRIPAGKIGLFTPGVKVKDRDNKKAAELIKKLDFAPLVDLPSNSILRAIREFKTWMSLKPIIQATLVPGACAPSHFLIMLGLRGEEDFPDPQVRADVIALYSKAIACFDSRFGQDLVEKAQYRLSLLLIWAGRCTEARPHLDALAKNLDSDFTTRGIYWGIHCANERGDHAEAARLKSVIEREYPLSFHGLILNPNPVADVSLRVAAEPPEVTLRSKSKPELNRLVRAIETLQAQSNFSVSLDLLGVVADRLDEAEPSFQLYIAILTLRAGDRIGKFKVLNGLFKDKPGMISRASMEMFYPLAKLDLLKKNGKEIDPLLIASLIRQESGFNENARSRVGAAGLMQIMYPTARSMEKVSKKSLYEPNTNVRLGVRYFFGLLKKFDMDVELALAAYNAGPDKVTDWVRRYPVENRILFLDLIPFAETRNYVALIVRNYVWYQYLYGNLRDPLLPSAPIKVKTLGK